MSPQSPPGLWLVREGPYAGADIILSRRFALLVQGLAPVVVLGLCVAYPPTLAIGATGWIVIGALQGLIGLTGLAIARAEGAGVFRAHLVAAYALAASLTVVQWLAGGWQAPYHELYLALLVTVSLIQTQRHALAYFALVVVLTLTPVAYGETHGRLGDVIVATGLWSLVVLFSSGVMRMLRAQRTLLIAGQDEAQDEARRDQLTGLENRRAFNETIEAALARARAGGAPLTLAVGDADGFKAINDVHGHLAGDRCLEGIARALAGASRSGDRIFRWGGDEFAVVIEGASEAEAAATCARFEDAVAASVHTPGGAPVTVTFGWARDAGASSPQTLIAAADEALLGRKRRRGAAAA